MVFVIAVILVIILGIISLTVKFPSIVNFISLVIVGGLIVLIFRTGHVALTLLIILILYLIDRFADLYILTDIISYTCEYLNDNKYRLKKILYNHKLKMRFKKYHQNF